MVLTTLRFDFNVQHPYRPLFDAMRKLGIDQKEVKQVAWNFVNDWYVISNFSTNISKISFQFLTTNIPKILLQYRCINSATYVQA